MENLENKMKMTNILQMEKLAYLKYNCFIFFLLIRKVFMLIKEKFHRKVSAKKNNNPLIFHPPITYLSYLYLVFLGLFLYIPCVETTDILIFNLIF